MTKPITAGSEVDAYCTKCKLELGHRVIAMDGTTIKRVECLTCRGHHNYRRAKSAAGATKRRTPTTRKTTSRKAAVETEERQTWAQAVHGRPAEDFTPYTLAGVYKVGELLRHKKFGDGVVLAMLEDRKMQVAFEEGSKTLVYGR